jgi:hypothetical protein
MANLYSQFTYDDALGLKDAGLVCVTATSEHGSTIIDMGDGLFDGFLVIDLIAVEVGNSDERFYVSLEGSTVAAMTSTSVCLATKVFGQLIVPMDAALVTAGRYAIPIRNENGGTLYRYVRYHITGTGTIGTGINFVAFLAKR